MHRHADGTEHVHGDDSGVRGLYVAQLSFARAGDWGVELLVHQANAAFEPVRLAVTVEKAAATPAVGSAAPKSRNIIARDVKDLRQIDTSPRPDPRLHIFQRFPVIDPEIFAEGADRRFRVVLDHVDTFDDGA